MPRPQRCRRICSKPKFDCFRPDTSLEHEKIILSLDEFETIRLMDVEKLTHEECANQMDISRTTVTEIYEAARTKIADSLVNGKQLCIEGGNYRICDGTTVCSRSKWCNKATSLFEKKSIKQGDATMKIAVTYENGQIFQHFGHSEEFKLYTVSEGKIISSEVVNTNGSGHGALAGFLSENGVDTLICGGIGGGAQTALAEIGIKLYGGVSGEADNVVESFLAGKLEFNPDVHCNHHDRESGNEHHCGEHGCGKNTSR